MSLKRDEKLKYSDEPRMRIWVCINHTSALWLEIQARSNANRRIFISRKWLSEKWVTKLGWRRPLPDFRCKSFSVNFNVAKCLEHYCHLNLSYHRPERGQNVMPAVFCFKPNANEKEVWQATVKTGWRSIYLGPCSSYRSFTVVVTVRQNWITWTFSLKWIQRWV